MKLLFHKYQGTGNDFIMIDDRESLFPDKDTTLIQKLCDRKFGIGADGLILIRNYKGLDFDMIYFNSDGTQSLCGNGSRCAVMFSHTLGICEKEARFNTIEGHLKARIENGLVHLGMPDVNEVKHVGPDLFINTGSPHYIRYVKDVEHFNVYEEGRTVRYSGLYGERGTNVNFVESTGENSIFVRTYERGVENETLSCGTGVTACALAHSLSGHSSPVGVSTPGGRLAVSFEKDGRGGFIKIKLIGPAEKVFEGSVEV
jgi:diaminopimelate epimerase